MPRRMYLILDCSAEIFGTRALIIFVRGFSCIVKYFSRSSYCSSVVCSGYNSID